MTIRSGFRSWTTHPCGLGLWLVVLAAIPCFWWGIADAIRTHAQRAWPSVPCIIDRAELIQTDAAARQFTIAVDYHYTFANTTFHCQNFSSGRLIDHGEREERQHELDSAIGTGTPHCHVNPQHPDEAYLVIESDPFGFVFGPAILLVYVLLRAGEFTVLISAALRKSDERSARPLSDNAELARAGWAQLALFAFLGVMWLLFVIYVLILPGWCCWRATMWVPTPCIITDSGISRDLSIHGQTFEAQFTYHYLFSGVAHDGHRIDFTALGFNLRYDEERLLQRHPVGPDTCFVDPANPTQAVLERRIRLDPLTIIFSIGLPGLLVAATIELRGRWRDRRAFALRSPVGVQRNSAQDAPQRLWREPRHGLWALLSAGGAVTLLALFVWVAPGVVHAVIDGGFGIAAFMDSLMPVLAGICASVAVWFARKWAEPAPILRLTGGPLELGGYTTVAWSLNTRSGKTPWLVRLEARENGALTQLKGHGQGNLAETVRVSRTFFRQGIGSIPTGQGEGELPLSPPATMVPSFDVDLVRIRWFVVVQREGSTETQDHPIVVTPAHRPRS